MLIDTILTRSFFKRDTLHVARELIGAYIVRRLQCGKYLVGNRNGML